MTLGKIALALVLVSLPVSASAQTARPCVTEAEARHVIKLAMPDVILGIAERCRAGLPAEAFLVRSSADFAKRFRPTSDASWPKAKPVLLKLAGRQAKLFENFPDSAARPMFSTLVSTGLSDAVKPEQCQLMDRALAAVSPLPDENMIELVLLAGLAESSRPLPAGKQRMLSICPAPVPKPVPVNQPVTTTATK